MLALIKHQIIEKNGKPLFVLVPYEEYLQLGEQNNALTVPQIVVEKHVLQNMSLIRAWREYLGLSQQTIAKRMGISHSAYSQMEHTEANPRRKTINKIATALNILPEQLLI